MKIQRKMEFQVPPGQKKTRIDKYLANHVENSSRTKIKGAIDDGHVLVNQKKIKANYIVQPNDFIDITLPYLPAKEDVKAENIPLEVLFEDDYLMIIVKPAGMVTRHYSMVRLLISCRWSSGILRFSTRLTQHGRYLM